MNAQDEETVTAAIELDAHEFGLHLKQGGWRLGLLVARDVNRGRVTQRCLPTCDARRTSKGR